MRAHAKHPAFSLIEMVFALALMLVLFLALYLAFSTSVFHAQAGRDIVAESTLARSILNRVASDITGQLGAVDPRPAMAAGASASSTPPANMAEQGTTPTPVLFNVGIQGDDKNLVLSTYRMKKSRAIANGVDMSTELTSDVRMLVYWMVPSGSDKTGLARAEISQATSPDIDLVTVAANTPTGPVINLPDPGKYVFAPEVKNITFEYFDSATQSWLPQWNGATSLGDSETALPTGPPTAIRITVELRPMIRGAAVEDAGVEGPRYQQIVAIPASNNWGVRSPSTSP